MNIREHRELGEALKHFAFGLPLVAEQKGAGVPNYVQDALTVINAARLTYDRYQECDCDDGKVMQPHDHEANCWEECVCGAVYEIHPSCGGVAVAFILRPAPQPAAAPVEASAAVAPVAAAPAAAAAPAPNAEDAPSEGELAAKAAAAKDSKSGESSGSSSGKRRSKAGGGDDAPSAAAGDGPASAAPAEKAPEKKKFDSSSASIDDLLSNALTPGSGSKPKAAAAPKVDDNLQPKPTRDQVLEAMNGVKNEVQGCAQGATGVAFAEVTVSGATGRVTNAQISGQTGAVGSCIARVVRKAKFPKFKESTFQVKFPYRLQ
jgi:hypothetical protein